MVSRKPRRSLTTTSPPVGSCPWRGATGARSYLSSEEQMSTAIAHPPQRVHRTPEGLRCRVRLADGRMFAGELAPERHRSLQIGLLHEETEGLVELAAGVRRDGRLQITTRRRADHFLPGGRSGADEWREALLELAAQHAGRGEEVFLAPAARSAPRGDKHAVCSSHWLWVDV